MSKKIVPHSPASEHPQDSETTQAYSSSNETILYSAPESELDNANAMRKKKSTVSKNTLVLMYTA